MIDEERPQLPRVTLEVGLDQLMAAVLTLPSDARNQLRMALDDAAGEDTWLNAPLTSNTDPVLTDLWNNADDAAYDEI